MTPFRGCMSLLTLAASPFVLQAQAPPAPMVWTIPGIANVAGRNGTRFVSDVAVTNPGAKSTGIYVSFAPAGVVPDQDITLGAGKTLVWRNVLQQLWGGAEASGAMVLTSDLPLLIRARTYNTAASGTFGVAIPAVPDDDLLSAGDRAHCLWISQSADAAKDFRTNLSVAFPDSGGGIADVTLFDQDGTKVGSWEFSSDAAGFQQVSVGSVSGSLPVGRAEIEVVAGRAVAYSSVVDNVTGDSSLFRFEPLPAGAQDVLVNGVARANGKNNTFFRTDGRFFNPGSADVAVTAAFHASGNSNPSPVTATFTVRAGKILDVTDVLATLLGLPVGSAGAVRFTSDAPVGILCRTSNVDPTGAVPGTYGSQQKPVPLLSFLSSADAGAAVTGVRQNAAYRTNIAMASGRDGATAQFTLKTAQGVTVGTATQTLGAYGWTQSAVDKLFGVAIPDDAEVDVKLTQGSADIYDSSVDNASGDSVVTPAPALPATIPASATIGPEGGSVQSADGRLRLKIPAGSLAAATTVSIVPSTSPVSGALGSGYTLSVDASGFATPPVVMFRYGPDDLAGTDAGYFGLASPSGATLPALTPTSCDTSARTVSALFSGLPAAGAGSATRRPLSGFVRDIVPVTSFLISPGEVAVLSGGKVTFVASAKELVPSPAAPGTFVYQDIDFASQRLNITLSVSDGGDPGQISQVLSLLPYNAPANANCGREIALLAAFDRAGQLYASNVVKIRVFPRNFELRVSAFVSANLCHNAVNYPKLSLTSDDYVLNLVLHDDLSLEPAGPGTTGDPGKDEGGGFFSQTWCPSSGCSCSWNTPPSLKLQFIMAKGGWLNGRFHFDAWGLDLNTDGFQKMHWTCTCPSGRTSLGEFLLPNIAGSYPILTARLWFDGPTLFRDGCEAKRVLTHQEFLRMELLRPRADDPLNNTAYFFTLRPLG